MNQSRVLHSEKVVGVIGQWVNAISRETQDASAFQQNSPCLPQAKAANATLIIAHEDTLRFYALPSKPTN